MKNLVIIPTYNESQSIGMLIEKIFSIVPDAHIMVVDDNSPDGTADIVKGLSARFPALFLFSRSSKEGLGKAYIDAFAEVKNKDFETIITMDGDLSHDPGYLPSLISNAETSDLVIGSRYIKGGRTEGWELWRRLLSRFGNFYCRLVTRMPVSDYTSGFNAINIKYLRKIDLNKIDNSGYAFLIELKYFLWKSGAKLKEVPIVFKNRAGGESKISNHIIGEGIIAPWKMIFKK